MDDEKGKDDGFARREANSSGLIYAIETGRRLIKGERHNGVDNIVSRPSIA